MDRLSYRARRLFTAGLVMVLLLGQTSGTVFAAEEQEGAKSGARTEASAEKLPVETSGDTAVTETGGFSLYTVEFTYDQKQYVLPGDSEVKLSEILKKVGLTGEATEVSVSDSSLFSAAKNEKGEWIVKAHKAFSTKEWMKVTISGVVYEITVTDDQLPAAKIGETEYGTIPEAITAAKSGDTIVMLRDVNINESLEINVSKTVTLDLNGYTIDRGLTGGTAEDNGYVIEVNGNLTLQDNSSLKTGKITGGNNVNGNGGGVCVASDGATFTMQGGTISKNQSNGAGGGVHVESGTFNMTGGSITDNNATGTGGGVCVSGSGTFNVSGTPVISGNFTEGIWDSSEQEYVLDDENAHSAMDDVAIAYSDGGAKSYITVSGELTSGASIYVNRDVAERKDTAIKGANNYTIKESDVGYFHCCDDNYVAVLRNGGIKFAQAYAIRVDKYIRDGTVTASPAKAAEGATVTLTITPDSEYVLDTLTVTAESGDNLDVSGTGNTYTFTMPADNVTVGALFVEAVAQVGDVKYSTVQGAIDAAPANGTVTLLSDVNINTSLTIASGKTVTLDLNDHYILYKGNTASPVITVNGSLTLKDSKTTGRTTRYVTLTEGRATNVSDSGTLSDTCIEVTGGFIAGGNNESNRGGGVYVQDSCMFTMEGGTIAGCKALYGGGVNANNSCMFTMEGGTIAGCKALYDGGGVFINNSGNFNMKGGGITNCTATGSGDKRGGGVFISSSGKFNMEGGSITDCTATSQGGGVYVFGGTFKVSGTPVIRDNKKGSDANNVALNNSKYITVTGALTTGAEIWVNASNGSTVAVPGNPSGSTTAYTITAADVEKFHSDDTSLSPGLHGGNVVLKATLPKATLSNPSMVYNGSAFSSTISFEGATLTKDSDYTLSYKKVVNTDETALSGAPKDAGSYKLVVAGKGSYAGKQELDFTITKKSVTVVSGITVKDKEYDGGTTAELITTGAVFEGKCDGDTLTVSATGAGAFEDADAGESKTVNIDATKFVLGGASAGNYKLAETGQQTTATADITKATPTINTVPTASAITYGQSLSYSNFTGGEAKVNGAAAGGTFAWTDGTIRPGVSDSNKTEYEVTFTPSDSDNLSTATCKVKLTVNKADIPAFAITSPTKIDNLKYTGAAQALVTAGSATGGTMQYKLGSGGTYSTTIPTAKDAGSYTVYYKVAGDQNHNDTTEASITDIKIEKADNNTINLTTSSYDKKYLDATFSLGVTVKSGDKETVIVPSFTVSEGNDVISVSAEGKVTFLKPGTAKITVSLPATDNYEAAEDKVITINVAKADAPKTKPESAVRVANDINKVSKVSLPKGWTWADADKDKELTPGAAFTATAQYTADDKDYYEVGLTASVVITRQALPKPKPIIDNSVKLKTIRLNMTKATMSLNQKIRLRLASYTPANATNLKMTWSTSNHSVAIVDANGLVTCVGPGNAKITAASTDGSKKKATCTITGPKEVSRIKITGPKTVDYLRKVQLSADITPSDAINKRITWSIVEGNGKVDAKGVVTCTGSGDIKVSATTANGKKATYTLKGPKAASSVKITGKKKIEFRKSVKLTANVKPDNAPDKKVKWTLVKGKGKIHDNGDGTCSVTCTGAGDIKVQATTIATNKTATFTVKGPKAASSVRITGKKKIEFRKSVKLTAIVKPDEAPDKRVKWTLVKGKGKIHDNGDGTCSVTCTGAGDIKVQATTIATNKKATFTVKGPKKA